MTRDETVALFLLGRETWNVWAEEMLAERKAMEGDGRWVPPEDDLAEIKPENKETLAWQQKAQADFSCCHFLIPGWEETEEKVDENVGLPIKLIELEFENIDFSSFKFPGEVWFASATFAGPALFENATFSDDAWFTDATFSSDVLFERATFTGDVLFSNAVFTEAALFKSATFSRRCPVRKQYVFRFGLVWKSRLLQRCPVRKYHVL